VRGLAMAGDGTGRHAPGAAGFGAGVHLISQRLEHLLKTTLSKGQQAICC